jgi:uncharacterized protein YndB with AHSA1/START domain
VVDGKGPAVPIGGSNTGPVAEVLIDHILRVFEETSLKTRTIRQRLVLPGTPHDVYEALMTTRGHKGFSGAEARISPKVGGKFMAWGGYIHGTNLKLVEGKTIVQSWVPSDPTWPAGHESKVRFDLTASPRGTRVVFTHSGVPAEHAGHLSTGWTKSYWTPLRTYLAARPNPRSPPAHR